MTSLYKGILRCEAVLAGFFLLMMVVLILLGGVARMMHHPLNWTIDLATCSFSWAAFLCADIAWRKNMLMCLDLVTTRLSVAVQRVLLFVNLALITVFLAYGVYAGTMLAWSSRARSFNGIPGVSYSWVTSSIAVGCALMLLTTLLKLRDLARSDGVPDAATT
jgi:TRAP-type C4-dicarboxylate transport system permease small subunit